MRPAGYTLIELLVVISIIAILAVVGMVNYKDFSANKVVEKATLQIQTYLRLAQSNATSSTICPDPSAADQGVRKWHIVIANDTTINLTCDTATTTNYLHKSYALENARIEGLMGQAMFGFCSITPPFTITYSVGTGALTTSHCPASEYWSFIVRNTVDTSKAKSMKILKGGSILVY